MESTAGSGGLSVGTEAPDFELPDANGNIVRLLDFRGRPVVLAVYPLEWGPGCSRQLDLYQQELDEFAHRGVEIVGISVDSIYSHGARAAARGITFRQRLRVVQRCSATPWSAVLQQAGMRARPRDRGRHEPLASR